MPCLYVCVLLNRRSELGSCKERNYSFLGHIFEHQPVEMDFLPLLATEILCDVSWEFKIILATSVKKFPAIFSAWHLWCLRWELSQL